MKFDAAPSGQNAPESGVSSSKAGLVAKRFKEWLEKKDIQLETLESEEAITEQLGKSRLLNLGVTAEEAIAELKRTGMIHPSAPVKVAAPVVEKFEVRHEKLAGLKTVNDPALQKQLEENEFFQKLEMDIFKTGELTSLYEHSLLLGKENSIETPEYYNAFADAGLIKGGREEVQKDLNDLADRQELFKQKNEGPSHERNKQVATIVERAIAYGVSELGWYGENVSIEPTSQFDDVKRRVDEVMEIRKEEDESSFMGLGIDVTYRGLFSEKYKEKLFVLLDSIQEGHRTKIKYFKNHTGQMMKEFAVPKVILYVNVDDVQHLAHMVKNSGNAAYRAANKNSPQKFSILNQMIIQCELLASFAEESRNLIFKQYTEIVSSIKELGWNNPDVQKILDDRHEDEASHHLMSLITEFKKLSQQKKAPAPDAI